jgi:histidine ammonia-lyase
LQSDSITLQGGGVTIADVIAVARGQRRVVLGDDARSRVVAARSIVDRLASSDVPIYGVNTALGANTGAHIASDERVAYQERAVSARAVGIGPRFPTDVVRAMMFARAAGMAVGGSGVSPEVLDALIAMLNARVHPIVPGIGSIGVADLAPLSHLALPLVGRGEAEYKGRGETGCGGACVGRLATRCTDGKRWPCADQLQRRDRRSCCARGS